jgi:hypothetical protein
MAGITSSTNRISADLWAPLFLSIYLRSVDFKFLRPRDFGARSDPLPIGLEPQAELVVTDPQIPIPATHDRLRPDFLHFLRQYTDIDLVGTIVGEPVEP